MNADLMIMTPETLQNEVCGCDRQSKMKRDVDSKIKTHLEICKHIIYYKRT